MSNNPGKIPHHPAKGQLFYPQDEEQGLPGQKLNHFCFNFFDLIDVIAILLDDRGMIRLFNHKAEKLTGHSRGEVIGQDWFSLLPEQERDRIKEQVMVGLRHGVRHMALSMPVKVKTGGLLNICWSLSLVRDDDGEAYGLFGLGFAPYGPDVRCLALDRQLESYCASINTMTHDMLNHSQVVMGYLEMAANRPSDDRKLQCMLDRATKAMAKCGNVAVSIYRLSNGRPK